MSFSNKIKNTTTFVNQSFGAGQTWGQSKGTWEDNVGVRWVQGIAFKHQTKNSTSFTNETKN